MSDEPEIIPADDSDRSDGLKDVTPTGDKPELKAITAALKQMVEVTQQEHDLKRGDQEVEREKIASNERLGLAAIEAQREFHKEHFGRYNDHLIHRYWFIGAIVLMILVFSGFAIWADAKDLVMDMAKLIIGVSIGAFGGFFYGKSQGKQEPKQK